MANRLLALLLAIAEITDLAAAAGAGSAFQAPPAVGRLYRLLPQLSSLPSLPRTSPRRPTGLGTLRAGLFDGLFGGGQSANKGTQNKNSDPLYPTPAPTPTAGAVDEKKPEWTELVDESSGKPYYWNELTGETSWVPPPSVLQAPLKEERLSDAAYYAKLTAQAGEVPNKFGDVEAFPTMYDGWFCKDHEWMGADGETPKQVRGTRQIETQMKGAVQAALAAGIKRMEVRIDPVPNLEEVDLGTALNQQFSFEIRAELGLADKAYKTEVRRNLVDWANHHWALKLAAGLTAEGATPSVNNVFIQHCTATDFSKTTPPSSLAGKLWKPATGDVSLVVNPGVEDQWKKALTFSSSESTLIFLNSISGGWTYELGGPIKEAEQVYYMKRVSKGWVFRCYPGPWQALVERPDGSVSVLATYDKRPLLRDASKVVREYSFEKFAIFNDRYAKGFGGRL